MAYKVDHFTNLILPTRNSRKWSLQNMGGNLIWAIRRFWRRQK